MHRHRRHRPVLLALGLLFAPPLTAGSLSLDESLEHALAHHPDLLAFQAQTRAAEERVDAAAGARQPELGLRYLARRSDNPLDAFADKLYTRSVDPATDFTADALNRPDASTLHATELSLRLPVYRGGGIHAGIRGARARAQSAEARWRRARELTAFEVIRAYRAAQAAAEGLRIAGDAVAAAREHAATTARLVRQGRTVVSDRMTAELNLAAAESAREQAANRQRRALIALKLAIGMDMDGELTPSAWQAPTPGADARGIADLESLALARRIDLRAAHSLLAAGHAGVDAARAAFRPQLDVVASSQWYDDQFGLDNNANSVMGVVSMNLWSGGRDRHGLAAARLDADAQALRIRQLERTIRAEVRQAQADRDESRARLAIAAKNVDKARETVRLVERRYGEGRTILIDVLTAERVLVEARNEELTAGLNLLTNEAALALATGTLALPES
jgi:outer membrane protein TolC